MTASFPPSLLATGFVVDDPAEGTLFPSAGGNSADPKVQAVYWRCLTIFFASARITNPDLRLALFTTAQPPIIDGLDISMVLARYDVEIHRVPLNARLARGKTSSWGNVLYFFDIMKALANEDQALRIAITDSDVLVLAPLAPLFSLLDSHDFAGYVEEETGQDSVVNGMAMQEMARATHLLGGSAQRPISHFGGELFMTTPLAWNQHGHLFSAILSDAQSGTGPAAHVTTEEHVFTIAFAVLADKVARANRLIRRIWTSPRHNTVRIGDEQLLLWHLPAEKRYGLRDLFNDFHRRGFPQTMEADQFRALARSRCGIPAKSPGKLLRDGIFQIALKLGYRR